MKRIITLLVLTTLLLSNTFAQTFKAKAPSGQTFEYTIVGNEATLNSVDIRTDGGVLSFMTVGGNVTIPSHVTYAKKSYPVTRIEGYVFHHIGNITSITLPSTIQTISEALFAESSLKSINMPNSIKRIESNAFFECHLQSITLSASLTRICEHAFFYVHELKTITIPRSVEVIEESAFEGCEDLVSYTLNNPNTRVDPSAFPERAIRKVAPTGDETFNKKNPVLTTIDGKPLSWFKKYTSREGKYYYYRDGLGVYDNKGNKLIFCFFDNIEDIVENDSYLAVITQFIKQPVGTSKYNCGAYSIEFINKNTTKVEKGFRGFDNLKYENYRFHCTIYNKKIILRFNDLLQYEEGQDALEYIYYHPPQY